MNINRMKDCAYCIEDRIKAIRDELNRTEPYASYLEEKAKVILNDIQVILEEIKAENKKEEDETTEEKFEEIVNVARRINKERKPFWNSSNS